MCLNARPEMRAVDLNEIVHHRTEEVRTLDHSGQSLALTCEHDIRRPESARPALRIPLRGLPMDGLAAAADEERTVLAAHVDEIRNPHEVEYERVHRLLKDFPRRADLLYRSGLVHDCHTVRDRKADLLIVRNVEHRDIQFALQLLDLKAHLLAQIRIQIRKRLIQKEESRLADQCTGQRNTLLLSAGQLRRQTLLKALHADDLDHLHNPFANLLFRALCDLQRISDIIKYRHVRPYGIVLEHKPDAAVLRRHLNLRSRIRDKCIVEINPACIRRLKSRDQTKENSLAAAGRAKQRKALPFLDRQRQIV